MTATGHDLWLELNGHRANPVAVDRIPHKCLGRGGSLGGPVTCPRVLFGWLVRNLERLIEELRFHRVRAGRLGVEVVYRDAPCGTAQAPLDAATDRFDLLLDALRPALRAVYQPGGTATHLHLLAADLRRGQGEQLNLFRQPDPKREAVAAVKAAINDKLGRFAVRSGATLYLPREIYADAAHSYDVCDIRGKFCF